MLESVLFYTVGKYILYSIGSIISILKGDSSKIYRRMAHWRAVTGIS